MKHFIIGSFAAAVIFMVIAITSGTANANGYQTVVSTVSGATTACPFATKVGRNAQTIPNKKNISSSTSGTAQEVH